MAVLLIRHADAHDPHRWDGDPDERPLTARGRAEAAGLVTTLAGYDIRRVLASPMLRCQQTVDPLATSRGLPIEVHPALAETRSVDDYLSVVSSLRGDGGAVAICGHGNIIPDVIARLAVDGTIDLTAAPCAKASAWVLDLVDGAVAGAAYLPPPAS